MDSKNTVKGKSSKEIHNEDETNSNESNKPKNNSKDRIVSRNNKESLRTENKYKSNDTVIRENKEISKSENITTTNLIIENEIKTILKDPTQLSETKKVLFENKNENNSRTYSSLLSETEESISTISFAAKTFITENIQKNNTNGQTKSPDIERKLEYETRNKVTTAETETFVTPYIEKKSNSILHGEIEASRTEIIFLSKNKSNPAVHSETLIHAKTNITQAVDIAKLSRPENETENISIHSVPESVLLITEYEKKSSSNINIISQEKENNSSIPTEKLWVPVFEENDLAIHSETILVYDKENSTSLTELIFMSKSNESKSDSALYGKLGLFDESDNISIDTQSFDISIKDIFNTNLKKVESAYHIASDFEKPLISENQTKDYFYSTNVSNIEKPLMSENKMKHYFSLTYLSSTESVSLISEKENNIVQRELPDINEVLIPKSVTYTEKLLILNNGKKSDSTVNEITLLPENFTETSSVSPEEVLLSVHGIKPTGYNGTVLLIPKHETSSSSTIVHAEMDFFPQNEKLSKVYSQSPEDHLVIPKTESNSTVRVEIIKHEKIPEQIPNSKNPVVYDKEKKAQTVQTEDSGKIMKEDLRRKRKYLSTNIILDASVPRLLQNSMYNLYNVTEDLGNRHSVTIVHEDHMPGFENIKYLDQSESSRSQESKVLRTMSFANEKQKRNFAIRTLILVEIVLISTVLVLVLLYLSHSALESLTSPTFIPLFIGAFLITIVILTIYFFFPGMMIGCCSVVSYVLVDFSIVVLAIILSRVLSVDKILTTFCLMVVAILGTIIVLLIYRNVNFKRTRWIKIVVILSLILCGLTCFLLASYLKNGVENILIFIIVEFLYVGFLLDLQSILGERIKELKADMYCFGAVTLLIDMCTVFEYLLLLLRCFEVKVQ